MNINKLRLRFMRINRWRLLLFGLLAIASLVISKLVSVLFEFFKISELHTLDLLLTPASRISLYVHFSLLFIAIILYTYLDYVLHRRPLVTEMPSVKYSPIHHMWVVTIPRLKHRRRELSYWLSTGTMTILLLSYSMSIFVRTSLAAVATVATSPAVNITQTSADLVGNITSSDSSITAKGFQYGTDTNYGQTVYGTISPGPIQNDGSFSSVFQSNENPSHVALDGAGNVYVTLGDKVRKLDSDGSQIHEWSVPLLSQTTAGVVVDSDNNIFVASNGPFGEATIYKFRQDYTLVTSWSSHGASPGGMKSVRGIDIDDSGNLYVADAGNNRILKFQNDGTYMAVYGSSGSGQGQLSSPQDIVVDASGKVYITELSNSRVQVLNPDGSYSTMWGGAAYGSGDGEFCYPAGIDLDSSGNVYVVDYCNYRIQKFSSTGTFLSKWGQNGTGSQEFKQANGLAVDPQDRVYVTDSPSAGQLGLRRFAGGNDLGAFSVSTVSVGDLSCGTTYHYRAFATSDDGTGYGSDETFTTLACSASIPSAPTNVTTSLVTTIYSVIEWGEPAVPGGTIESYSIEYKRSSDATWTVADDIYSDVENLSYLIGSLTQATAYDVRIAANNSAGKGPYATISFTTPASGSHSISTCDDLQDIRLDLSGAYHLTKDIDCSSTASWNDGLGFMPIGYLSLPFTGTLDGHGYKVSGLTMDHSSLPGIGSGLTQGLFAWTENAIIKNIRLENIDYLGGYIVGGLTGVAVHTAFDNVSVSGEIRTTTNSNPPVQLDIGFVGGIAGVATANAQGASTISRSFSEVSILLSDLTSASGQLAAGGLVGSTYITGLDGWIDEYGSTPIMLTLENTFFKGTIANTENSDWATWAGGLIGWLYLDGQVTNSYTAGTIDISNGDQASPRLAGGLIGYMVGGSVSQSFSVVEIAALSPSQTPGLPRLAGGLIGGAIRNFSSESDIIINSVVLGSYYDAHRTGQSKCYYLFEFGVQQELAIPPSSCTAVNGSNSDSAYFINNKSNEPLLGWDFGSVWRVNYNSYPDFVGSSVTPPSPPNPPTPTPTPTNPEPQPTTPTNPPTITPGGLEPPSPITTGPLPVEPGEVFVPEGNQPEYVQDNLPEAAKDPQQPERDAKLPFLFISLLLLIALAYALQAWREYRRQRAIKALIRQYDMITKSTQAFLQIVAHYLNTPLAVLQNALEMLALKRLVSEQELSLVKEDVSKLSNYSTDLQNNIQTSLMPDGYYAEQAGTTSAHVSAGNVGFVAGLSSIKEERRMWAGLLGVAVTVALLDIAFVLMGSYKLASLRLLNQFLFFSLGAALLILFVLFYRWLQRLRTQQEYVLSKQQQLYNAKISLLNEAAASLDGYYTLLHKDSAQLQQHQDARLFNNGLHMLGEFVQSLTLVIKQTDISPPAHPVSIAQVLAPVIDNWREKAADKAIRIDATLPESLYVRADGSQIAFVANSLLDNALKFAPKDSLVRVRATQAAGKVKLTIIDQGPGLTDAAREHLFEPFNRGVDTETYDTKGVGIGLYNAKFVTERLGGSLDIKNGKPSGSVAEVTLPAGKVVKGTQAPTLINPHNG